MTSPFKKEITIDGTLTTEQAKLKWEQCVIDGARKGRVRGKALFLHSLNKGKGNNKYVLQYYQNFGGDFCEAMFTGEIFAYEDDGCQITGEITVSPAMKRFSWVMFALAVPLAFAVNWLLRFFDKGTQGMPKHLAAKALASQQWLYIFAFFGTVVVAAVIAVACRIVDKRKVNIFTDYLYEWGNPDYQR